MCLYSEALWRQRHAVKHWVHQGPNQCCGMNGRCPYSQTPTPAIWVLPSCDLCSFFFFFWTPNHLQSPSVISVRFKHWVKKNPIKTKIGDLQSYFFQKTWHFPRRVSGTSLRIHVRSSRSAGLRAFQDLWSHHTRGWLKEGRMPGCHCRQHDIALLCLSCYIDLLSNFPAVLC